VRLRTYVMGNSPINSHAHAHPQIQTQMLIRKHLCTCSPTNTHLSTGKEGTFFEGLAIAFDCEEDMLSALSKDTEAFRGKVVVIRCVCVCQCEFECVCVCVYVCVSVCQNRCVHCSRQCVVCQGMLFALPKGTQQAFRWHRCALQLCGCVFII
jgi:hypothetical protein